MERQPLKTGTRIEVRGVGLNGVVWQPAKIARRSKETATWAEMPGWYIVRYQDGASLTVHQESIRVVDNR